MFKLDKGTQSALSDLNLSNTKTDRRHSHEQGINDIILTNQESNHNISRSNIGKIRQQRRRSRRLMISNEQNDDSSHIQKEYGSKESSIDIEESVSNMSKDPAVAFLGKRSFDFLGAE